MRQLIRDILREETIKKFDKSNANRGKFSDVLEKMVIDYIGKENICDVIAEYSERFGHYIVMVLYNGSSTWNLDRELQEFMRKILPFKLFTIISDTKCDEK